MDTNLSTTQQIIEVAFNLMVERGYNAFSYADIATQIAIRKASIHYHFPSKSDLGTRVVAYYRATIQQAIGTIDQTLLDPQQKLRQYIKLTSAYMQQTNHICLCALLAAEFPTLPANICKEVRGYFTDQKNWFATILADGQKLGLFTYSGSTEIQARKFLSGIHGAMLASRAYGDTQCFNLVAQQLVDDLIN